MSENKDGRLWIRINRPEARNALDLETMENLVSTLWAAEKDPKVDLIILTGEGKSFCAGGDIKNMINQTDMFEGDPQALAHLYRQGIQEIPRTIEKITKPMIAAVNGSAVGAGCDLACMCDLRIASKNAFFSESFAKLGIMPGDGGAFYLQRIVGYAKAMEMILTADRYSADEAKKMGLVSFIVEDKELYDFTDQFAQKVQTQSIEALRFCKMAMKQGSQGHLDTALDFASALQGIAQRSTDHFRYLTDLKARLNKEK